MDPRPETVTTRDNGNYIRAFLYSNYTNTTGGGPPKLYGPWSELLKKGVLYGIVWGHTIGVIKGETRSSDYSLYGEYVVMHMA